ncbi:tetrathionate reductase family octaheme c-type cytochrome [Geomonas oryzisoli]|uniref:Tetrathionate reductase family octaheme c-type cytochrome n=1 Tax=Geomonas oryzisoli TaxID=2847992 RepID=A0ABX8J8T0_9BACT|nr:tetrathionate reductase family octaheme c-type cytochrome [Geomonas oryzisoli]QWV94825.1 tetrathionate reductase family octaheme c-type cytochrome [Geomonas oryzisoli]
MRKYLLLFLALACASTSDAALKGTHRFITEPFHTGPEVTRECSGCHEKLTKQITQTVHWNWGKKQSLNGKTVDYGKKNALGNSFCLAVPSNLPGCTSCHAGYGWEDSSFDFTKTENIDCLICHDTSGTYKKFALGAGHPVYAGEHKEYPAGKVWEPVDLVLTARSISRPTRAACGNCHFYSGGGENYKHGDLDANLANPTPEFDVHMGAKGLTCESCHKAANHDVKGEAISVSPGSGPRAMGCTDCHKGDLHKIAILNKHMKRVACQTCHIPTYAKGSPTVLSWDWSTAGKDQKTGGDPLRIYDKARGDLVLGKDLTPTLMWYNGTVERVFMGDKIDPSTVVRLSAPRGDRSDPDSRIFPFKVMHAKQPYDLENNIIAVPNIIGPAESDSAYSVKFDWGKAITAGMREAGLPYSGKYGWVETTTVWSLNHMVVPKDKALRCQNCHGENGRIDWKGLGYTKDPRG